MPYPTTFAVSLYRTSCYHKFCFEVLQLISNSVSTSVNFQNRDEKKQQNIKNHLPVQRALSDPGGRYSQSHSGAAQVWCGCRLERRPTIWRCTLASPGGYDRTVHLCRLRGLVSKNYFGNMFNFMSNFWQCIGACFREMEILNQNAIFAALLFYVHDKVLPTLTGDKLHYHSAKIHSRWSGQLEVIFVAELLTSCILTIKEVVTDTTVSFTCPQNT